MKRVWPVLEFAAAYAVAAVFLYYGDTEYRLRVLDLTRRTCYAVAFQVGIYGMRAETEYHRVAEMERMN